LSIRNAVGVMAGKAGGNVDFICHGFLVAAYPAGSSTCSAASLSAPEEEPEDQTPDRNGQFLARDFFLDMPGWAAKIIMPALGDFNAGMIIFEVSSPGLV
jgi:hypothetical protein